jgi:hypothetical protein
MTAHWNQLASALAGATYRTLTVRTVATPPLSVNLESAAAAGPPSPVLRWLKPTVELEGPAGRQVIAPYGEAADGTAFALAALGGAALLLLAGGFALGRLSA